MSLKKTDFADGTSNGVEKANIAPATEFAPSGAPIQIVPDVDPSHPAVDNDPRKDTTLDQNRIDFNDPTLTSEEAVAKNLGIKVETDGEKAE